MSANEQDVMQQHVPLSKKDFETPNDVRWCPGCGDYAILAAVQKFLPSLNIPREQIVFISGIGCSSRFPYYMNTYGFHTIHGRAPAIATGVKLTNPDLSVWLVTGDGDALSIGGNHIIHLLRRNLDINVLLFNNRIYGLTKGQYSPTSELGKVTKSTPHGSSDFPINPLQLALGAQATFVARSLDVDAQHLGEVLKAATEHRGTSFIEIYQNCNIFNDGAFINISERSARLETQLRVEHGSLLIFGAKRDKGIRLNGVTPEIVTFADGDESAAEALGVIRYDSSCPALANIIATMTSNPELPVPMGVLLSTTRPTFDALASIQAHKKPKSAPTNTTLNKIFQSGDTWTVTD